MNQPLQFIVVSRGAAPHRHKRDLEIDFKVILGKIVGFVI